VIRRAIALAACLAAVAPVAGATNGRLSVAPSTPVVGSRVLIRMRLATDAPLYLQLTSPTGVPSRLRLTQVRAGLWQATAHFPDDGQWTLRVLRAHVRAQVSVLQPGAAIPPFKPNTGKASALSGIAAPGVVLGH
jgi:hypothetical protein